MELGNAVFGNARGNYKVPRVEWEKTLAPLFEAMEIGYHGEDFENGTFKIMPYWWGGCTCGWAYIDNGHSKLTSLEHKEDCISHPIWELDESAIWCGDEGYKAFLKGLKPIYEEYGLNTGADDWWHGCMMQCTCDYDKRNKETLEEYAEDFGRMGHKPDCKLIAPNFLHKPSGYALSVYKYFCRDTYANQNISLDEFEAIVSDCIESLKGE